MNAITRYLKSLLLLELGQGAAVTLRYFFEPKFTIKYPEEKTPEIQSLPWPACAAPLPQR